MEIPSGLLDLRFIGVLIGGDPLGVEHNTSIAIADRAGDFTGGFGPSSRRVRDRKLLLRLGALLSLVTCSILLSFILWFWLI
jgi:hypothetical protein